MLAARDAILGRVVEHEGVALLCGIHPRALPPLAAADVVDDARRLRRKRLVPAERLRDEAFGRFLIAAWEDAVAGLDDRRRTPPKLANTSGDSLLLTINHFGLDPAERGAVLERLGGLVGVEAPESNEREAVFTVVDRAGRVPGGTIRGTIRVLRDALRIETNSVERAADLRRRVEAACHRLREHSVHSSS